MTHHQAFLLSWAICIAIAYGIWRVIILPDIQRDKLIRDMDRDLGDFE